MFSIGDCTSTEMDAKKETENRLEKITINENKNVKLGIEVDRL
jgi:hypothetical protein